MRACSTTTSSACMQRSRIQRASVSSWYGLCMPLLTTQHLPVRSAELCISTLVTFGCGITL